MVMLDWYLIWMLFYWNVPGNCNFLPICFGTCAFVPEELMMDLLLVWVEYPPYQIKALKLARACGVPAVGVWVVDCWQWLSGHYCHHSFHIFFFSVTTFSHRSARITKLISQKLFRLPFWGTLVAIFYFEGSAALQAMSECPIAARLVFRTSSW